jgi:hypothetical protein
MHAVSVVLHCPLVPHVCTALPEHCEVPGVQLPVHTPALQAPVVHATGLPH